MLTQEFLISLRNQTEDCWREITINPTVYGYQFQPGTRWNAGLTDAAIAEYEALLRVRFPHDLKAFLKVMNGTDTPMLNVYGNCGEPPRHLVEMYAYPRDLAEVKRRIKDANADRGQLTVTLGEQGFVLAPDDDLVPIYGHRYIVCTSDPNRSVVLSVADAWDAIVYGTDLQDYLEKDFLTPLDSYHK